MKPYYQDSACTIYHGDCREILPQLGKVDLVLTDPPYAVSVSGARVVGLPGKGSRNLDFFKGDSDWASMTQLVTDAIRLSTAHLETIGSLYCWCGHRMFGALVADLEASGFSTRFLVWEKECPPPPAPGAGWPSGAELCIYAYRPGRIWNYRGSDTPKTNVIKSDSFRFGQPGKLPHPTQKPLTVISPLILASSRSEQLILDPFMGSGTTLRAAKDLGRKAIGIELEENYCEIAAKRLSQEVLPLTVAPSIHQTEFKT